MSTAVDKALAAALYAEDDAALDTGASLLAADPAADAEPYNPSFETGAVDFVKKYPKADGRGVT
ncbi:hypothetical protein, partial [Streptomyces sp. NPDC003036]|uniref:hypothetical protein n=1 Tax=Streptomyces sp. NPDC003036 TaxID=3154442 RepID=UPI0033B6D763